jgi:glycosyltransferase involved in cell wall biosynthesis
MKSEPRIAFVTDALPIVGGAEKTLFAALECFPNAEIFTLIYNKAAFMDTPLEKRRVFTSYLDRLPFVKRYYRFLLPLMPRAVERFDLHHYDTVVSFSYAVANGAKANSANHFSYTHTPMRYAWRDLNVDGTNRRNNFLVNQYMRSFRRWDKAAASRIYKFGTISNGIARWIQSAYGREAQVIYPPVEVERFHADEKREAYYVVLSRLVSHKRVDLIVEAFSRLKLPLKVIGVGPERNNLQQLASTNIEFLGFQSDECVAQILGKARGLLCATAEDFGIAIVEAQASGCPVITYGQGGALETVIEGVTGAFFYQQSVDALYTAVEKYEHNVGRFRIEDLVNNAQRFNKANFQNRFSEFIGNKTQASPATLKDVLRV